MIAPPPAPGAGFHLWRLDEERFRDTWDSGIGAAKFGGRWNRRDTRAVYASLDPATAILEVAVHKGFGTLDAVPHVITSATVNATAPFHVVMPGDVPNPNWLVTWPPTPGQQAFGDALLRAHPFVLIPSVVSRFSWNVIFDPGVARGLYARRSQDRFALDPRLAAGPGGRPLARIAGPA